MLPELTLPPSRSLDDPPNGGQVSTDSVLTTAAFLPEQIRTSLKSGSINPSLGGC